MRIHTYKASRGLPSLLVSGGSTSAASQKRRPGVREGSGLVTVENGRRITVAELCRSVGGAASRFLRAHNVQPESFSR